MISLLRASQLGEEVKKMKTKIKKLTRILNVWAAKEMGGLEKSCNNCNRKDSLAWPCYLDDEERKEISWHCQEWQEKRG